MKDAGEVLFTVFVVTAIVTGFIWIIWANYSQRQTLKAMDYTWYRFNYPEQCKNGRVHCYSCGNHRIYVRGLMQRTFMREHFCARCGTTLYYSPEGH